MVYLPNRPRSCSSGGIVFREFRALTIDSRRIRRQFGLLVTAGELVTLVGAFSVQGRHQQHVRQPRERAPKTARRLSATGRTVSRTRDVRYVSIMVGVDTKSQ